MIPTKEMTPHVPVSPQEIIDDAVRCAEIGARIVHIHPRDEMGKPTWKKEVFAKIIDGIRSKTDQILISATTSGRFWDDFERRAECLELKGDLKPDLASLTVGSNNFIHTASINSPTIIHQLAQKMMDVGIKPELEVFELGMVHKTNVMLKKGLITNTSPYFNILLGSLGTSPLHPAAFAAFHALLPENAIWSVAGIGRYQLAANILGLVHNGHIRVGLEDNIYYQNKVLGTNDMLVARIVGLSQTLGRDIATIEQTREILAI
jgi:uncharacterized protein (DUF849 family)